MSEPFFSVGIPNYKAKGHLGGNSRAGWQYKHRLLKAEKALAFAVIKNELNRMGLDGRDFLTNLGEHNLKECFPVCVTFRRFYSRQEKLWDDGNLYSAYKGITDGISQALGVDDRYFKTNVEQIRDDFTELEICICPAWALMGRTTNL